MDAVSMDQTSLDCLERVQRRNETSEEGLKSVIRSQRIESRRHDKAGFTIAFPRMRSAQAILLAVLNPIPRGSHADSWRYR